MVGMRLKRIAIAKLVIMEYRPFMVAWKTTASNDGPACEYYLKLKMQNQNKKPTVRKPIGVKIIPHSHTKVQKKSPKPFVWNAPKPTLNLFRPASWSQFSCFENPDYPEYSDPERWYRQYVLNQKDPPTPQLIFGSMIDKKIQEDPTFLPELERFPKAQYEMKATLITPTDKIKLIGFADGWDHNQYRLKDDKTGVSPWTQARADKTGQFTWYLLELFLMHSIKPEQVQCQIDWIPTQQNADLSISLVKPVKIQTFYTKRTMTDILKMAKWIENVRAKMIEYAKNHK